LSPPARGGENSSRTASLEANQGLRKWLLLLKDRANLLL
jgi:hypothetical protein